jgi:hypothetical protein
MAYLLRCPISEVRDMEYDDYLKWHIYFGKRPAGWQEDARFLRVMQMLGAKERPEVLFPSLACLNEPIEDRPANRLDVRSFQKSALFQKLAGAVGGKDIFASNDQNKGQSA